MTRPAILLRRGAKGVFFFLMLVFSLVPVLQTAHALTHFAPAEDVVNIDHSDGEQEVDQAEAELGVDAGVDSDRICLDCLALAALGTLLPALAFCFFAQTARQPLSYLAALFALPLFSLSYLTRAPPQA